LTDQIARRASGMGVSEASSCTNPAVIVTGAIGSGDNVICGAGLAVATAV
jgi:hypothetical protein